MKMGLSIIGDLQEQLEKSKKQMARAATGAMKETAELAKRSARQSIAAAGFSSKWQSALRNKVYPQQGVSLTPGAIVYHKIPYAGVFEEGATISGKPMLWLPLDSVPLGRGGNRISPADYVQNVGPLTSVNVNGKAMLFGRGSRAGILRVSARAIRLRKSAPNEAAATIGPASIMRPQ